MTLSVPGAIPQLHVKHSRWCCVVLTSEIRARTTVLRNTPPFWAVGEGSLLSSLNCRDQRNRQLLRSPSIELTGSHHHQRRRPGSFAYFRVPFRSAFANKRSAPPPAPPHPPMGAAVANDVRLAALVVAHILTAFFALLGLAAILYRVAMGAASAAAGGSEHPMTTVAFIFGDLAEADRALQFSVRPHWCVVLGVHAVGFALYSAAIAERTRWTLDCVCSAYAAFAVGSLFVHGGLPEPGWFLGVAFALGIAAVVGRTRARQIETAEIVFAPIRTANAAADREASPEMGSASKLRRGPVEL